MKRRDVSVGLLGAAGAAAILAKEARAQSCNLPCYPVSPAEIAAQVTPTNTQYPPQNVLRYGADPTGVAYSTNAFAQLAQVIAKGQLIYQGQPPPPQGGQIEAHKVSTTVAIIPEGFYTLNGTITWQGPVSIVGAGTAGWEGGTTIVQTNNNAHIFVFNGYLNDGITVGVHVYGISFGFAGPPATEAAALYVPKLGPNFLSSNSLYFEDCRFGGFNPYGRFLVIDHGNDICVSRCLFDVSFLPAIQLGNDQDSTAICTDVAINDCGFYNNLTGIRIYHARGVTITGNRFFKFLSGQVPIYLGASTSIVPNSIQGIEISGNTFNGNNGDIVFDGSTNGVQIANNQFVNCQSPPFIGSGATNISGLQIGPNSITVATNYSQTAVLSCTGCQILNSTIAGNRVNCNGVSALNQLATEVSGASQLGQGMTLRDNDFFNNPTYLYAGHYDFKPCSARGLVLENGQIYSGYPSAAPVFHLNAFQLGQSLTFDLDWEVIVNKPGADIGAATGRDRVSIIYWQNGGSLKATVTRIASVSDNFDGGGANIPSVAFSVTAGPPANVVITVTDALSSPQSVTVNLKASNFRATAASGTGALPQIKNA
jgi:hypothetical protein